MSFKMTSTNAAIVAMLGIAALGAAFWILALSPKRDEAKKLGTQIEEVKTSLSQHRAEIAQGLAARKNFDTDYEQLVVLGSAVPGGDETASLLVQLNQIAKRAGVKFNEFSLESGGGEAPPPSTPPSEGAAGTPASNPVSPTEVAASTMPLGATIGPAGLGVMPYTLSFRGDFFHVADFIRGLDSLVKTTNGKVAVNGRLLTVNGFSLAAAQSGFPTLEATFNVTTYLTPPSQGVTGGATPAAPAASAATPASTTLGGTP
jgi:type II secretory pathway pseudopilin PulG